MKKKFALVLALCMLVTIAAAGCGEKAAEETLPEETPAVTSEVTEPVREKPMKDGKVETPYGTLTIPETVVEYIDVRISQENVYTLTAFAQLEGHQQDLFDIRFGDTVNNAMGILETAQGEALYVGIDFYPFVPDDTWSQEQIDLVLTLQEMVNDLLDQMELKDLPSVKEEPSQAMTMDTLLGDLQYPDKWETYLTVETNADSSVSFYGVLPGREAQLLFRVAVGGETGHITKQLANGQMLNVFLAEPVFDDSWSEEEQNLIYAMQEDVNYLLDTMGA